MGRQGVVIKGIGDDGDADAPQQRDALVAVLLCMLSQHRCRASICRNDTIMYCVFVYCVFVAASSSFIYMNSCIHTCMHTCMLRRPA